MSFIRTEMLIGKDSLDKLKSSSVALFGVGGVGSFAAEALARAGVGTIFLFDNDIVDKSNINRQLIALESTIGQDKVAVMRSRILDINPFANVSANKTYIDRQTISEINFNKFDYVIDAVDTVTAKLLICKVCYENSIPVISCMGTGNKLDPSKLRITDIKNTSVCRLARVMRKEIKALGIPYLDVLFSTEQPVKPILPPNVEIPAGKRQIPGSISFVPSVAGLMLAGWVINRLK